MVNEGDAAPDVTLPMADGSSGTVASFAGHPLVLYFYPKDDTPGCTTEAKDFTALADEFEAIATPVIGISKDSAKKHLSFTAKHALKVRLASDTDDSICEAFGTWVEKSMYGKTYLGIERATFLIGADGRIAKIWRKVKVAGHAEAVLAAARTIA